MDAETTRQVLTVVASMLLGAVMVCWVLVAATQPPRGQRPPRSRARSAAHPAGRHRPEVIARAAADAAARADVVRHNAGGGYRYGWAHIAVGGRP